MILIPGRSSKQGTSLNKGKLKEEYQTVTSTLEVNEDDMTRLGLEAGDKVKLSNEIGETIVSVKKVLSVMRKNKISNSYDTIKKLTRGKELNKESYRNLIENLPINEVDKTKLLKLTPIQYTGLASYLAKLK